MRPMRRYERRSGHEKQHDSLRLVSIIALPGKVDRSRSAESRVRYLSASTGVLPETTTSAVPTCSGKLNGCESMDDRLIGSTPRLSLGVGQLRSTSWSSTIASGAAGCA